MVSNNKDKIENIFLAIALVTTFFYSIYHVFIDSADKRLLFIPILPWFVFITLVTKNRKDFNHIYYSPDFKTPLIDRICGALKDVDFDIVVSLESEYIFGASSAYILNKGFVFVKEEEKKDGNFYSLIYDDYDVTEIKKGQRVVVIGEVLETGETCKAAAELIEEVGGVIEQMIFFFELDSLNGREILDGYNVKSLVSFD